MPLRLAHRPSAMNDISTCALLIVEFVGCWPIPPASTADCGSRRRRAYTPPASSWSHVCLNYLNGGVFFCFCANKQYKYRGSTGNPFVGWMPSRCAFHGAFLLCVAALVACRHLFVALLSSFVAAHARARTCARTCARALCAASLYLLRSVKAGPSPSS